MHDCNIVSLGPILQQPFLECLLVVLCSGCTHLQKLQSYSKRSKIPVDGDGNEIIIQKNSHCLCPGLWESMAKREESSVWAAGDIFTGQIFWS